MRFKEKWSSREFSLSEVILRELTATGDTGGVAECADVKAENLADAFSRLLEKLHDKGLLTTGEVVEIAGLYGYDEVDG